jgi:hypothetical protein
MIVFEFFVIPACSQRESDKVERFPTKAFENLFETKMINMYLTILKKRN